MGDRVAEAISAYQNTELQIHAWVEVNPQEPLGDGPLEGIPFGVKDIFETKGLATEYGSPLYAGRKGAFDAEIVVRLRELGAILFGKTQTTAFAFFDPGPTRNPRNTGYTPGGSSSGSAAAVAAGVVPLALGSQTMGSVIRPASFCGVVGFKPTFDKLPVHGMLPFAPSLDTVGLFTSDVATCMYVWRALGFPAPVNPVRFAVPDNLPAVSEEMQAAFEHALDLLGQEHEVERFQLPESYEDLLSAVRIVNNYEGAQSHYEHWCQHSDGIGVELALLVKAGRQISEHQYEDCRRRLREVAAGLDTLLADTVVLLTPSALGSAPLGLASTGDPIMNAVWTGLGSPVAGIPMPHAPGMPLGLQLIAARDADGTLLNAALAVERSLQRKVASKA